MIRAYNDNMLEKAQVTLGSALDFAAHDMGYPPGSFMTLFVESGLVRSFEKGSPAVLMGRSGIELVLAVLEATASPHRPVRARRAKGYSKEFWVGWALAYYQWWSGLEFSRIMEAVPIECVRDMYEPYHEMDVRSFAERMDELYVAANPDTALKRMRRGVGLTQEGLSRASGIPVRTIQQYEQRRKDVNKAQLETVMALAQVLGCRPEQLYERVTA